MVFSPLYLFTEHFATVSQIRQEKTMPPNQENKEICQDMFPSPDIVPLNSLS